MMHFCVPLCNRGSNQLHSHSLLNTILTKDPLAPEQVRACVWVCVLFSNTVQVCLPESSVLSKRNAARWQLCGAFLLALYLATTPIKTYQFIQRHRISWLEIYLPFLDPSTSPELSIVSSRSILRWHFLQQLLFVKGVCKHVYTFPQIFVLLFGCCNCASQPALLTPSLSLPLGQFPYVTNRN